MNKEKCKKLILSLAVSGIVTQMTQISQILCYA